MNFRPQSDQTPTTHLLRLVFHQFQTFVLPPSAGFVHVKLAATSSSAGTLNVLHHLARGSDGLLFRWWWNIRGFRRVFEQLVKLNSLLIERSRSMAFAGLCCGRGCRHGWRWRPDFPRLLPPTVVGQIDRPFGFASEASRRRN